MINSFNASGLRLSQKHIQKLLSSLPNLDKKLILSVLGMLNINYYSLQEEERIEIINDKQVMSSLQNLLMKNVDDVIFFEEIFPEVCLLLGSSKDEVLLLNLCLKNSDLLLKYYLKNKRNALNFCIAEAPEISKYLISKINEEDIQLTTSLLLLFSDISYMSFLTLDDLNTISALTNSNNKEISDLSKHIMCTITHEKNVKDWAKWWHENRAIFDLKQKYLTVLTDKNTDLQERICAAKQLRERITQFDVKDENFIATFNALINIIDDTTENFNLRVLCLKNALIMHYSDEEKMNATAKTVKTITNHLIVKEKDKRFYPLLLVGEKHILDDDILKTELLAVLRDKNVAIETRAYAAYALRLSSNKRKEIASEILKLLATSKQDGQITNLFRFALEELCKKKCGTNINAWQKAVSEMPDDPPEEEEKKK
jgi:hypothetical protein